MIRAVKRFNDMFPCPNATFQKCTVQRYLAGTCSFIISLDLLQVKNKNIFIMAKQLLLIITGRYTMCSINFHSIRKALWIDTLMKNISLKIITGRTSVIWTTWSGPIVSCMVSWLSRLGYILTDQFGNIQTTESLHPVGILIFSLHKQVPATVSTYCIYPLRSLGI